MIFHPTEIPGIVVIEPEPVADERGHFALRFSQHEINELASGDRKAAVWSL
jgi:dTDP-4-dehydrorhamnose 3,5-epimerase-like enzyme